MTLQVTIKFILEDPPYDQVLRGKILKEYHPKMTDIEKMKYWLINN